MIKMVSLVDADMVTAARWIAGKLEGKKDNVKIISSTPALNEKLIEEGYDTEIGNAEIIAVLGSDDIVEINERCSEAGKLFLVASPNLKFYDLYEIFEKFTDNFKIYNISNTKNMIAGECFK